MRALPLRAFSLVLAAGGFIGCGQIDSSRSGPVTNDGGTGSVRTDHRDSSPPMTGAPGGAAPDRSRPMPMNSGAGGGSISAEGPAATADSTRATGNSTTDSPTLTAPITTTDKDDNSTQPDNTRVNRRDRDENAKTPTDQGENSADIKTTAAIRQKVVGNKDLSINAHNVKIITSAGKVTLRGPVNSDEEHDAVVAAAREVAGDDKVDDQLEVKSDKVDKDKADTDRADKDNAEKGKADNS
jgi:hypothetical protein